MYSVSLALYPIDLDSGVQVALRGQCDPVYNVTVAEEPAPIRGVFNGPCVTWGSFDTV